MMRSGTAGSPARKFTPIISDQSGTTKRLNGCCCVVSGVRPTLNAVFSSVQYMHPTPDTASAPRQEVTVAALHPLGDSAAVRTTHDS